MKFRSPLSRAQGLGSAKHGFSHWWLQRISAIALIPLTIWFVFSMVCLSSSGYYEAIEWLSSPFNAAIMLLFTLTALFHGQTGLQTVIEDYIHSTWLNLTLLLSVKFASVVLAVLAIISIMKIVLGG